MNRLDSYKNAMTKLGTGLDKSRATTFEGRDFLDYQTLECLYEFDGTAAKIIDTVVDDAIEGGFTVESEDIDWPELKAVMKKTKTLESLGELWRWARLYGGAVAIPLMDSRSKMASPLQPRSIRSLTGWNVIPSPWVHPELHDSALQGANFSRPKMYRIGVPHGTAERHDPKSSNARIHWTRVIRMDGCRVSPYRVIDNDGWSPSVLERVFVQLRSLGSAMGYAENILHEISMLALKLEGFRDAMTGGKDSQDEMARVLANIKQNLDLLHVLGMDTQDELIEVNRNVSGLEALIVKFEDALVRVTGMSRNILLGQSPAGMNANGGHERKEWNKKVAKQRDIFLLPALEQALRFHLYAQGKDPDELEYEIKFAPVDPPTPQEKADTAQKEAQADEIYYRIGVASAEEIRERKIADGSLVAVGDGPDGPPSPPAPQAPEGGGDGDGEDDPEPEQSSGGGGSGGPDGDGDDPDDSQEAGSQQV